MANFWGNSSSQYIAKKIIHPDILRNTRRIHRIVDLPLLSFLVRFW
jgi:hypothetical protein